MKKSDICLLINVLLMVVYLSIGQYFAVIFPIQMLALFGQLYFAKQEFKESQNE